MQRIDYCKMCEVLTHVWHRSGLCDDCRQSSDTERTVEPFWCEECKMDGPCPNCG